MLDQHAVKTLLMRSLVITCGVLRLRALKIKLFARKRKRLHRTVISSLYFSKYVDTHSFFYCLSTKLIFCGVICGDKRALWWVKDLSESVLRALGLKKPNQNQDSLIKFHHSGSLNWTGWMFLFNSRTGWGLVLKYKSLFFIFFEGVGCEVKTSPVLLISFWPF